MNEDKYKKYKKKYLQKIKECEDIKKKLEKYENELYNLNKKKNIKFTYSNDSSIICKQQWIFIKEILDKKDNWIFNNYNKDYIYDWVNSKISSIISNNSNINNYCDNTICSLCNKYDFHLNLNKYDFLPETYNIYNNKEDILKKNIFNYPLLLKKNRIEYSNGIFFINNKKELEEKIKNNEKYVLQKLVKNPKLYNNRTIDIRFYIILTYSINGINVYLYKNGYKRICEHTYKQEEKSIIVNKNKNNTYFIIDKNDKDYNNIIVQLIHIIKKTFENILKKNKLKLTNNQKGYHLLGCDFIQDKNNKLWFIEVNHYPSLNDNRIILLVKKMMNSIVNMMECILLNEEIKDNNVIKII